MSVARVWITVALASLLVPFTTLACDCIPGSPAERLSAAVAVFEGTVETIKEIQSAEGNPFGEVQVVVSFEEVKWMKGGSSAAILHTVQNRASCNGYFWQEGARYEVYARTNSDGTLGTSFCYGTRTLSSPNHYGVLEIPTPIPAPKQTPPPSPESPPHTKKGEVPKGEIGLTPKSITYLQTPVLSENLFSLLFCRLWQW